MCSPAIGLGLGVAGVAMQAYGKKQEITANNQAAEYNARIALQNKQIMEENAKIQDARAIDALARGDIEEKQFRQNVSRAQGRARASMGASGASVRSGSFADYEMDYVTFAEQDAMTIQHNARMEAWGYAMEARNARMQGGTYDTQAQMLRATKQSAVLPVASTILTGATALGSQYGMFSQKSAGPSVSSSRSYSSARATPYSLGG